MKIADLRITPIALSDPPLLSAAGLHAPYALRTVVEVETDDGKIGLAEVPGSRAVDDALLAARAVVLGADPRNWNALQEKLTQHFRPEPSSARGMAPWDSRKMVNVHSALDVACLDLAGQAAGVPVATLLGGIVREKVPFAAYLFYKHAGAGGEHGFNPDPAATGWAAARQKPALDPDAIVQQAKAMLAEFGFQTITLKGGVFSPLQEIAAIKALWRAFGSKVPLRLDPNALWGVQTSLTAAAELEGALQYLKDPCRSQEAMAAVRRGGSLPIATSMCTASGDDLPGSIRHHSEDIILADHHSWGGLHASVELANVCRAFGRGVAMHSSSHAGISLAAMTHLGAALPNLVAALDTHYPWQSEEVIAGGRVKIEGGVVAVSQEPGLGVQLDRAALARAHQTYLRCGLKERNDELEMQKKVPGWKFSPTRW